MQKYIGLEYVQICLPHDSCINLNPSNQCQFSVRKTLMASFGQIWHCQRRTARVLHARRAASIASSCHVRWFGESHKPCAADANDPWWRNRWCCRDMLWPTICAWEVVRRHCWISGKARRSCLRWLELACRWQCYSPAQTDEVETQKGLIGNLILLPQASPLRIFVRKVLP